MILSCIPTLVKAVIALSKCSFVCAAESCTLILALSFGTTGKKNPITYIPFFRSSSAIICDNLASYNITGTIAESPSTISKPAYFIAILK